MRSLLRLDCESTNSAYASLAAFSGLARQKVLANLNDFSKSADNELSGCERWEALANWLSVPNDCFEVCWFHGTRTANPESFSRNGILPLRLRLDGIWKELAELLSDKVEPNKFALLRQEVERENYGIGRDTLKARMRDEGPYAFLIKAIAIKPTHGQMHNYSRVPEIVDIILSKFPEKHRDELKERYFERTKPCIVKFISRENERQIIGCAADYLLYIQMGYPLECFLPWNFDAEGQQIPRQRILYAKHIDTNSIHH